MTAKRFGLLCFYYLGIYKASKEQMEAFGNLVQEFVLDGATEDELRQAILFVLDIPVTIEKEEIKINKIVAKALAWFTKK